MNTKVRFVRCPKCQLVLHELPEIPVYKCGGCNTLLQAKHRKTEDDEIKQPQDAVFECKDSSTEKKNKIEFDENNSIIVQLENHVPGDENITWHLQGTSVSDDSIELTSIDIVDDASLDEDRYDPDRWREIVSDNVRNGGCSKDSSFFMTDSSPENGLLNNKQKGKSVFLSRQPKREADELFKDWTFKGLRSEQSDSIDTKYLHLPRKSPPISKPPPRRMCCNESGVLNSLSSKIEMHCQHGYNRPGVYDPVSPFQDHETRHYGLCRTRPQNEEYVWMNSRVGQRNDHPASCYHNSGLCSPDTPLYSEPDKLELLKTINKLKDEIKRSRISNYRFSGEQMKTHYMAYEPRVISSLPLHKTCCNEVHCLNHTLNKGSCSSAPSHQYKERESSSKRYIRPTGGGSPFITCYNCYELLQLPVDFVLFGRRRHKLRCNACRKTMEFSIQGKRHLTPCIILDAVAPPPSDSREARVRRENVKELSPKSEAALHRLMGYSSISQVIRAQKPLRKAVE